MTTEKINSNKPIPLKKETIEPFISFEKNGIRPVIGFTQTEYRGDGKIHKNFYGGYNKIAQGKEEYISIGDGFLSASDAMIAILKQVNIPVKSKQSQPEQPEIDCAEMSFNEHFEKKQSEIPEDRLREYVYTINDAEGDFIRVFKLESDADTHAKELTEIHKEKFTVTKEPLF